MSWATIDAVDSYDRCRSGEPAEAAIPAQSTDPPPAPGEDVEIAVAVQVGDRGGVRGRKVGIDGPLNEVELAVKAEPCHGCRWPRMWPGGPYHRQFEIGRKHEVRRGHGRIDHSLLRILRLPPPKRAIGDIRPPSVFAPASLSVDASCGNSGLTASTAAPPTPTRASGRGLRVGR